MHQNAWIIHKTPRGSRLRSSPQLYQIRKRGHSRPSALHQVRFHRPNQLRANELVRSLWLCARRSLSSASERILEFASIPGQRLLHSRLHLHHLLHILPLLLLRQNHKLLRINRHPPRRAAPPPVRQAAIRRTGIRGQVLHKLNHRQARNPPSLHPQSRVREFPRPQRPSALLTLQVLNLKLLKHGGSPTRRVRRVAQRRLRLSRIRSRRLHRHLRPCLRHLRRRSLLRRRARSLSPSKFRPGRP
jgi:hypothetical protein